MSGFNSLNGNPFGNSDMNTPLIDAEHGNTYSSSIKELSRSLGTFQQHIDKASSLIRRIGTNRDNQNVRDQIKTHLSDGRELVERIAVDLKDFKRFISEARGSEKTKRRSQQKKLVKDFQLQMKTFERISQDFLSREEQFRRRLSQDSNDGHHPSFSAFGDSGGDWGNLGGTRSEEQQPMADEEQPMTDEERRLHQQLVEQEMDVNEAMIQERKEELQNVHSKIVQVNDIFSDLAGMVEDQGEQIEQIQGDLQFAAKRTEAGNTELTKANNYQKSTTKKLACCGIFIFVVVVVVVLVTLIEKKT